MRSRAAARLECDQSKRGKLAERVTDGRGMQLGKFGHLPVGGPTLYSRREP